MRIKLLFFFFCSVFFLSAQSQITFLSEHEALRSNLILIDDNLPKIYVSHNPQTGFSLYNLDGSLFREFDISQNSVTGDVQISYITRSLFDCDTSTVEYVINHVDFPSPFDEEPMNNWVKIMNDDGSELFSLDNATLYEGNAIFSAEVAKAIVNSPNGALMKVGYYYEESNSVLPDLHKYYQLCGSLPILERSASLGELTGIWEEGLDSGSDFVIFPNPSNSGTIQFELNETQVGASGVLRLFNMNGQLILENQINSMEAIQSVDVSNLTSGTYLLNVQLEDGTIVSEKLVKL